MTNAHNAMFPDDDPVGKEDALDHRKCGFGKWKDLTPIEISELPRARDREYIIWAYETVERHDRPVFCSEALYRSMGGKGKSARQQRLDKEAAEERRHAPAPPRPATGFDDMDDDIPF